MTSTIVLLLAVALGIVAGLRALTPLAVSCWGAHLGWINLHGSHLSWMGSVIAVGIFTLAALGELVTDKLPSTPARTAPPSLIIRMLSGGICGAVIGIAGSTIIAAGMGPNIIVAVIAGVVGALIGTFGGYQVRHMLTHGSVHAPDLPVALVEDLIAIGLGLFVVTRFR